MDKIAHASSKIREELFSQSAYALNTTNAIIEKDFWVVWILDKIFAHAHLNKILMFKGGTSLSKVFHLIGRFSEDIDLILDWREITQEDLSEPLPTKNKQVKRNEAINQEALRYIQEKLLPIISEILSPLCTCSIDEKNPYNIQVNYPAAFKDSYLRPQILLEIGPLASWLPYGEFEISSYAAEKFPQVFEKISTSVKAIVAKRTFWEKATILHQEANRDASKSLPIRYSRHYYDLAMMTQSAIKDEALQDKELLEHVVAFKMQFYPSPWAKFEDAKKGTLKLIPPEYRLEALKKDYEAMQHMIFEKQCSFDELMMILQTLEDKINH
ncbi:nucleotidyl transferase AbiEii/AbiGii toxin family protein [Sulfurospirillum cavolei]|uniref:nucleotidyl transferase AbiEii/AbiGii toxin family protein n=1 Tax=Sulfurospirillum cavolei TaxID=366522 RepID=UPI0005A7E4F7|nr:nucleotidyl transferase AbiEii/AbiGii toxin family protein [Sulfurospirillum cavolei]